LDISSCEWRRNSKEGKFAYNQWILVVVLLVKYSEILFKEQEERKCKNSHIVSVVPNCNKFNEMSNSEEAGREVKHYNGKFAYKKLY
jgi:hypothetical protein